ncbi:MAG: hypothetical protein ABUT20_42005 [Bacteroidota bacterium]
MNILQGFLLTLILAATSCSSSKKITAWEKPGTVPKNYTKILVLGFMRDEENSVRENLEGRFSEQLRNAGINAVSSLELFGTKVFDKMDEDDALYQLNNSCIDAVFTITLLNKKKEKKYLPGIIDDTPYSYYYDRFWRYRNTIKYRIAEPGYYDNAAEYFIECNLYDMRSQKIIYSVHTSSSGFSFYPAEENSYIKSVVNSLVKKNIIQKK